MHSADSYVGYVSPPPTILPPPLPRTFYIRIHGKASLFANSKERRCCWCTLSISLSLSLEHAPLINKFRWCKAVCYRRRTPRPSRARSYLLFWILLSLSLSLCMRVIELQTVSTQYRNFRTKLISVILSQFLLENRKSRLFFILNIIQLV